MNREAASLLPGIRRIGRWHYIAPRRLIIVGGALLGIIVVLGVVAMALGTLHIGFFDVIAALLGRERSVQDGQVVRQLRLPRVMTAIFAGAALGVSGAVFQSVSRNALGSPDVIGFTTGAATGAIVQIVVFQAGGIGVSVGAVVGGLATALVVHLLSLRGRTSGGYRMVLIGIGIGAVLSAVNGLLLVSGDIDQAITANLWLSGSLDSRKWTHAVPVAIGVLVLVPGVGLLARRAALMEMGDDLAQQLGVPVERTRVWLMLLAVALAGVATGAAGPIAFVALAAPQLVLRLTRSRGLPVFTAGAMGACLLIGADVLTQLLPITAQVPIGRMTGIIGGIYLIWLLTRTKQV